MTAVVQRIIMTIRQYTLHSIKISRYYHNNDIQSNRYQSLINGLLKKLN